MPHGDTLIGTVTDYTSDGFFQVQCPDAAPHLHWLNLRRWQMRGAKVGDKVELRYEVTSRSGLWNVSRILNDEVN